MGASLEKVMNDPSQDKEWRKSFDFFDKNKNGQLDRDEIRAFLKAFIAIIVKQHPESSGLRSVPVEIFQQKMGGSLDANGDGVVTFDEFKAWVLSHRTFASLLEELRVEGRNEAQRVQVSGATFSLPANTVASKVDPTRICGMGTPLEIGPGHAPPPKPTTMQGLNAIMEDFMLSDSQQHEKDLSKVLGSRKWTHGATGQVFVVIQESGNMEAGMLSCSYATEDDHLRQQVMFDPLSLPIRVVMAPPPDRRQMLRVTIGINFVSLSCYDNDGGSDVLHKGKRVYFKLGKGCNGFVEWLEDGDEPQIVKCGACGFAPPPTEATPKFCSQCAAKF